MPDLKIEDLPQDTAPANNSRVPLTQDPGGSPQTVYADVSDLLRLAYGSLMVEGGATLQALAAGTPTVLDGWTTAVSGLNLTADTATNDFALDNAGTYEAAAWLQFAMSGAETVTIAFYWNGAQVGPVMEWTTSGTETVTLALSWQVAATIAAQKLDLRVTSSGGADITLENAAFHVHRVA